MCSMLMVVPYVALPPSSLLQVERSVRGLERDRASLERDEKKLILDIKKQAKAGQMKSVKIMAKDLVRIRKHQEKFVNLTAQLRAISLQMTVSTGRRRQRHAKGGNGLPSPAAPSCTSSLCPLTIVSPPSLWCAFVLSFCLCPACPVDGVDARADRLDEEDHEEHGGTQQADEAARAAEDHAGQPIGSQALQHAESASSRPAMVYADSLLVCLSGCVPLPSPPSLCRAASNQTPSSALGHLRSSPNRKSKWR